MLRHVSFGHVDDQINEEGRGSSSIADRSSSQHSAFIFGHMNKILQSHYMHEWLDSLQATIWDPVDTL